MYGLLVVERNGAGGAGVAKQLRFTRETSKGEAAVTDLAMQILFAESAEEHAQAARQAALSPVVFSQIADKFGGHAPHKEVVISFLRRNGFTENAAAIAVRTYVNSMEYVESLGDNERSDSGSETHKISQSQGPNRSLRQQEGMRR